MGRLDQVVFFSKRDLAWTNMLDKADKLLNSKLEFAAMDLNHLLEFHHIHQYFVNDLFLDRWTDEQKTDYLLIVKTAIAETRTFLLKIAPKAFITEVGKLDFNNWGNFWELFQYFEVYKRIDSSLFTELLAAHSIHIRYILPFKQLVNYYNNEVRSFLLTHPESAELMLSHYEEKNTEPSNYIFPKSLTDADKHEIIVAYLDSPQPNLNYVELAKNSKYLKLPPKTLLKAKQIAESIKNEILTDENSFKISVETSLVMDQLEPVVFENKDDQITVYYGGKFFDTLETDSQLFSMFSDLFIYTDEEGLITLVSKNAEMDVLEKLFMRSKNGYLTGVVFAKKDMLARAQLQLFDLYLSRKGRSIEGLLESVVKEMLIGHFKMDGLTFAMPDSTNSPSDKIRLLAPEMEYLLKQYKNFVNDGFINHDLLQIDSTPIFYSELPSLLNKKYVSSTHEIIRTIQYHFFDENSILAGKKNSEERKALFHKFKTGVVQKSDFEDYQLPYLEQAVEAGDLSINNNGIIQIVDPAKIIIAGKLRKNESISYWHFSKPFRSEIDRLIADGILETSDKLFTLEETRYLNFYLNKKEFSNGQDLRNKYLHGSNDRNVKRQEADYIYFLRTFILILLKLKDDLTLNGIAASNSNTY